MDEIEIDVDLENQSVEENLSEPVESVEPNDISSTGKENVNQKLRIVRLPLSRIKSMMKLDPDCILTSSEAVILVTKATEMFIDFLAKESGRYIGSCKRKTMTKRHVETAIENCPQLCFLDGALEDSL